MNTYKNLEQAEVDSVAIDVMIEQLNCSQSAKCRDQCGLWIIRGKRGYISTWGDGDTARAGRDTARVGRDTARAGRGSWHLVVDETTPRKWGLIKNRLLFCELTQDGAEEGCFRLKRAPTASEAIEIRDIIGLRQKPSASQWAHLSQWAFRAN